MNPSQNISNTEEPILHSSELAAFNRKLEPNRKFVKDSTATDMNVKSSWNV